MQTQQAFLTDIQDYYESVNLKAGDPDHVWEMANYPTPRHIGGKQKVPLTKYHHALHGVIQSEETGSASIFAWEGRVILNGPFVDGWFDLLDSFDYWMHELKREAALTLHSKKLPDGRSAYAVKAAKAHHASR
ncbi:hypothetical protein [Synechococcus sp. WH 8016]|uniref:hypothetical protein n=1 Tax=Synechococcus sp. WH 8016 TaxID=166318 RepID=UPI00022DA181|nr:hypothetical protein [Synechococcus sp. WH 8016]EHA64067.1 hypothetical protein Syn8016DRAFT_1109 [Synechococcus sp. WH 8016]